MKNTDNEHTNTESFPPSSTNSRLRVPPSLVDARQTIDKATPERRLSDLWSGSIS